MTGKVIVFSRKGNTKKVADAIASATGFACQTFDGSAVTGPVDILFLGSGIYAGRPDEKMLEFCAALTPEVAPRVALFSSSAKGDYRLEEAAEKLQKSGIIVCGETFACRGKFLFLNRRQPSAEVLQGVASWAKNLVNSLS